jgi:hypothetical protein
MIFGDHTLRFAGKAVVRLKETRMRAVEVNCMVVVVLVE